MAPTPNVRRVSIGAVVLVALVALVAWASLRPDDGPRAEPVLCDSSGRHLDGLRTPTRADLMGDVSDVRLCVWKPAPPDSDATYLPMVLARQRLLSDVEARGVLQALRDAGAETRDCVNTDGGVPRAYSLALSVAGTPTWRVWVSGGACPELRLRHGSRDPRELLRVVSHLG